MIGDSNSIAKRQEQIESWSSSVTNQAPSNIKEADKIKFPKEVQFLCACNSNDWPEIERLLQEGININCTQDDGLTALHQACIDDDQKLVKFLVEHGAIVDAKDKEGWTPLFAAISCGYKDITMYLIEQGAQLDLVSYDGELPINQSQNEDMTSYLREQMSVKGLDEADIRNRERNLMLHDVQLMEKTRNYENYFLADNGATMLHVAASKDYTEVLEKLLSFLPTELINKVDNDGWNALHVASYWGYRKACVMLVEADIDFDHSNKSNQIPIEVADDEVKPYLREEIRKARFRRQDKPVKRPAEVQNGEYQPSSTKIPCPDEEKSRKPAVSPINGTKEDSFHSISEGIPSKVQDNKKPTTNETVTSDNKDKSIHPTPSKPTPATTVNDTTTTTTKTPEKQPLSNNLNDISVKSKSDKSNKIESVSENAHKPESKPTDISSKSVPEPVSNTSDTDVSSSSHEPSTGITSEINRLKDSKNKRKTKKPTQPINDQDLIKAKNRLAEMGDDKDVLKEHNLSTKSEEILQQQQQQHPKNDTTVTNTEVDQINDKHDTTSHQSVSSGSSSSSSGGGDSSKLSNENDVPNQIPPVATTATDTSQADTDLKSRGNKHTGGHVVNKRKVRNRPPTTTVDIKDIQAAQERVRDDKNENISDTNTPNTTKSATSATTTATTAAAATTENTTAKLKPASENAIDYKVLYENECQEKDKLFRNLNRLNKELQKSQEEVKQLKINNRTGGNGSTNNSLSESDFKEIERLREENKKMKEANSALIRVISRLSNSPSPLNSKSSS